MKAFAKKEIGKKGRNFWECHKCLQEFSAVVPNQSEGFPICPKCNGTENLGKRTAEEQADWELAEMEEYEKELFIDY